MESRVHCYVVFGETLQWNMLELEGVQKCTPMIVGMRGFNNSEHDCSYNEQEKDTSFFHFAKGKFYESNSYQDRHSYMLTSVIVWPFFTGMGFFTCGTYWTLYLRRAQASTYETWLRSLDATA